MSKIVYLLAVCLVWNYTYEISLNVETREGNISFLCLLFSGSGGLVTLERVSVVVLVFVG